MASRGVVAELCKGDKLNGKNYHVWQIRIKILLEVQELLGALEHVMEDPGHMMNREAFSAWKAKDIFAKEVSISNMENHLKCQFYQYPTALDVWATAKDKYGTISTAQLRQLAIKFDNYKMRPHLTPTQHLRETSRIIRELKAGGYALSDMQQVHAVIRSLPDNWKSLKILLTHLDIKTFANAARHVELEEVRLNARISYEHADVTEGSSEKASSSKETSSLKAKRYWNKQGKGKGLAPGSKKPEGKLVKKKKKKKKKDKSKLLCYRCGKKVHFIGECSD